MYFRLLLGIGLLASYPAWSCGSATCMMNGTNDSAAWSASTSSSSSASSNYNPPSSGSSYSFDPSAGGPGSAAVTAPTSLPRAMQAKSVAQAQAIDKLVLNNTEFKKMDGRAARLSKGMAQNGNLSAGVSRGAEVISLPSSRRGASRVRTIASDSSGN